MRITLSESDGEPRITRAAVLKLFVALLSISFLLRIFYAGHLYQDDGLWFTAAEELLRGKALYREIYFDKPPGLPLLYAALFKLFGAHIIVIRLFTILYAVAGAGVLYLFGSRLYGRRAGMIAAAMFVVFSTTFTTGHVQGLNTDFLMTLPYAAGAYLMVRSLVRAASSLRRAGLAAAGGVLAGVAFQVNPKAVFNLVFFALALALLVFKSFPRERRKEDARALAIKDAALLMFCAAAGFAAGSLPFLLYLAVNGALPDYRAYVWEWGALYAGYHPAAKTIWTALAQTLQYFALNNVLLVTLIFVVADTIRGKGSEREAFRQSSALALAWLAASYAGLAIGGRFFGHYFFQIIPALCLTGAGGLVGIDQWLAARDLRSRSWLTRRRARALLALGLALTLARFHGRTLALASDWLRGEKSAATASWFHDRLNREERMAAAAAREYSGDIDLLGPEALRARGEGYLFVWGYRPEIYYWSGMLPASRYLSSQPLTGVPADVHYFGGEHRALLDEQITAQARSELAGDLELRQPKYVIDELGFFNADLSIEDFPELREFMKGYKKIGATGRFLIYRKKDLPTDSLGR